MKLRIKSLHSLCNCRLEEAAVRPANAVNVDDILAKVDDTLESALRTRSRIHRCVDRIRQRRLNAVSERPIRRIVVPRSNDRDRRLIIGYKRELRRIWRALDQRLYEIESFRYSSVPIAG